MQAVKEMAYGQKEKRSPMVFVVVGASFVLQPHGLVYRNGRGCRDQQMAAVVQG